MKPSLLCFIWTSNDPHIQCYTISTVETNHKELVCRPSCVTWQNVSHVRQTLSQTCSLFLKLIACCFCTRHRFSSFLWEPSGCSFCSIALLRSALTLKKYRWHFQTPWYLEKSIPLYSMNHNQGHLQRNYKDRYTEQCLNVLLWTQSFCGLLLKCSPLKCL